MGAATGTIPYFSTYQPGALPIASTVYIEIVDSLSATSAQSWNQSQIDFVGKAPAIIPNANPVASDRFAFFQVATGLPKACTLGNFGVPFGNVPTGGSTGQMLVKLSGTNFDAGWSSIIQGAFGVVGTATITGSLGLNGTFTQSIRKLWTSTITYYVRVAGSDSNDGLTALTAFATVQKALDTINFSTDQGGQTLIIDIGAGNWGGGPFQVAQPVGCYDSNYSIRGAGSTLTSISLGFRIDGGFSISQLALDASLGDGYAGLYSGEHAEVIIGTDVLFKTNLPAGTDIYCYDSAAVTFNADFKVTGNKATFYTGSGYARLATLAAHVIDCTSNPDFSTAFLHLGENMVVEWLGITYTGTPTGSKFQITGSNVTLLATVANLPGNTAGTYVAGAVNVGETLAELATATTFAIGGTTVITGFFQIATTGGGSNIQAASYDTGSGGANINFTMEVTNFNDDNYGDGIGINYSRGTLASPLPVGVTDDMGPVTWRGYDGNDFSRLGQVTFRADGAVTATSTPGAFVVSVNPGLVGNVISDVLAVRGTGAMVAGTILSNSSTGGIGYALGAGSATTQITSKATGVTLNTVSGQITTHTASLAGGASVFFIVTNSNVGASDVPFLAVQSAATSANYRATPARVVTGSFGVVLSNLSTGALGEAVVLNYVLFKGVAA